MKNYLMGLHDPCMGSQKYSSAILPVTMNGFVAFAIRWLFFVNIIILYELCK